MKLHRYKLSGKTIPGTYIDSEGKYYIEKGTIGWNLYEIINRLGYQHYEFLTAFDTLQDIRNDPSL